MNFHSRRFGRAASSYGEHSGVQTGMAESLLSLIPRGREPDPDSLLEFGCGTGILTRMLRARFPAARILATDASERMLAAARLATPGAEIDWQILDAMDGTPAPLPAWAARGFALAASNALVQWFPDLKPHFALAASCLAPRGIYLVSGFTPGNFPELNSLLREPPFAYSSFPGNSEADVAEAAAENGLSVESWSEASATEIFPGPEQFLAAIKAMGSARRPETGKALTRAKLAGLIAAYRERYGVPGGVRATWKSWQACLRKP